MPAAVMTSENYDKLLEQCEVQELEAPGGVATPQVYAQLLALYLLHNDMNNARYLWKRIPQAIKTANPELIAIWAVGQRIWQRDFPGIYSSIAAHQWSESIQPVMEALRGRMDIQTGQVVRPPSPMESLEKQLSCPICLEMFTKPVVILPCQHNLCRGCANDLYDSRNPYHYSGGIFRCPTCRFEVVLDRHGVFGLQRNLLVENIIDIYKQQQQQEGNLETPVKSKEGKEPLCQEHEDERINIYCITCQVPTCSLCKVFGAHKDCEVSPLQYIYQTQKAELSNAIDLLVTGNSCVQALLNQMEDTCKAIQENTLHQKKILGEKFDLLYAILEEKKGLLLEKISQEEDTKVQTLHSLVEQHTQQLQDGTKLMDAAVQAMEQSSVAEFLFSGKLLIAQAKEAAKNSQIQRPEPGFEKMDHFTVITEHAEAVLAKMDFGVHDDDDDDDEEEEEEEEEEE
ncbi:E3 ubiquitin-protein ligase TRIM63 isoform X2 [Paramormyrops kingsleyae]|uniref:E3 ubiquitin-protein ligase TRIM63 isoform X2 n=1 Tax=Paramormyrops kingsleyae TaxID=1676925 RepID=UPI003B96FEB3